MLRVFAVIIALCGLAFAIEVKIDYRYDTNGFFNASERKVAIEAVADFYGDLMRDRLLKIDTAEFPNSSWTAIFTNPTTGNGLERLENLVVPEDSIIIFVGARDLGGSVLGRAGPGGFNASGQLAWYSRIRGRGNPGAEPDAPTLQTDFAPWGGSAAFDSDRAWNFSLCRNQTGFEFVAVALHEIGHVLGIGTSSSWSNRISDENTFFGPSTNRSFADIVSVNGTSHINRVTSKSFGSFGVSHGLDRSCIMQPTLSDNGSTFLTVTDLDLAILADIGWETVPLPSLQTEGFGAGAVSMTWNTTGFLQYQVERAQTNLAFSGHSEWLNGTAQPQAFFDTAPPRGSGFYRLAVRAFPSTEMTASLSKTMSASEPFTVAQTISVPEIIVGGCGHEEHED